MVAGMGRRPSPAGLRPVTAAIASDDLSRRLDAAERIAREAGALALSFFQARGGLVVEQKSDAQDRVSQADRQVEALIRGRVAAGFPDDAFLGEESGASAGASGFTWVIDPIDGTSPFLCGLPDWCVSVAVAFDGEPVIGVIDAPRHRETWVAARGRGATLNAMPLHLSGDAGIADGFLAVGASLRAGAVPTGRFITALMQAGGVAYHNGSGALLLAYVASGRVVGYYDAHIKAWDCFAGMVLVEEAGGHVSFGGPDRMRVGGPLVAGRPNVMATIADLRAAASAPLDARP
jgi:myo-inositol-1(or 4)-monophosphatase